MEYQYQPFLYMQQIDMARMPAGVPARMPFYMSYPMQNLYLTEMEYEKDLDRMKELYPREAKKVLEYVEDECDKMEYEGSLMFDEYPDRFMMEQITDRIYQKMQKEDKPAEVEAEQFSGPPSFGSPSHRPPQRGPRDDLRSLIGVLLNNEMYRRRCRHRRCNRWW